MAGNSLNNLFRESPKPQKIRPNFWMSRTKLISFGLDNRYVFLFNARDDRFHSLVIVKIKDQAADMAHHADARE